MGTDIHITLEKRNAAGEWVNIPNDVDFGRNYALFGWLADVRNYSGIPVFAGANDGLPADASLESVEFHDGLHTAGWGAVESLVGFHYDQIVEDRRVTRQIGPNMWSGGCTADAGDGRTTTYRGLFGGWYFKCLDEIQTLGAERILFSFDS